MPDTKDISMDELKGMLTKQLEEIKTLVPSLVKQESTETNKLIDDLIKNKIPELEKGIKAVEEQKKQENTFGLPGLEYEKKNFSWGRFYRAMYEAAMNTRNLGSGSDPWKGAEFEKEVCDQYAKRRGVEVRDGLARVDKDYNSGEGANFGFLVAPEVTTEIIDMVYPLMPIMNMPGVMKVPGLRGDLPVPKLTSKASGYHVGETGKPTESTGAAGLTWLRPKKIGAFSKQSNRLLYQTSGVSDTIIKRLLSQAIAEEWHRGMLNGTGSNGEALGLLASVGSMTAGTALGTNGGRFLIDTATHMQQKLAEVDEMRDTPTYGYLMHPTVMYGMRRERILMYSGGTVSKGMPVVPGIPYMSQQQLEGLTGFAMRHSTQVPKNVTKGTSTTCSKVLFGDWSQFWVGTWRDLSFKVSDVAADGSGGSAFLQDQLYIVAFMEYDCQLMRPAAFCYIPDAETTEANW